MENVTSPSASNPKSLALGQTENLHCKQENKITEKDNNSNIDTDVGSPNSIITGSAEDESDPDSDHDYEMGEDLKQWLRELCAK